MLLIHRRRYGALLILLVTWLSPFAWSLLSVKLLWSFRAISHKVISIASPASTESNKASDTFTYHENNTNRHRDRNDNKWGLPYLSDASHRVPKMVFSFLAILMIIYTALFITWDLPAPSPFFPLPGLMMSKVYSNSMLVLLNNRVTIVDGRNTIESVEFIQVPA
jgi:hypothetical protein